MLRLLGMTAGAVTQPDIINETIWTKERCSYFYDLDNNLFEIHCGTLEQRLKLYQNS